MSKNEKEIPAKLRDFTPLLDSLVKKYDVITAAVWGRVWRYQQGKYGVCIASHDTIAKELNLSERTVIRKLQELASDGYLKDHTPDLRNRPHTYSTTQKARIEITISGVTESHTTDELGVTESHGAMTESQSGGDRESDEDTSKKKNNKDVNFPNGKDAETPPAKKRTPKSKKPVVNLDHLKPSTPETIKVFQALSKVQRSKGHRDVKYFGNDEQKARLEEATAKLKQAGKFEDALLWALQNERTSRVAMVNALVTWAENLDKPKPEYKNGTGKTYQQDEQRLPKGV